MPALEEKSNATGLVFVLPFVNCSRCTLWWPAQAFVGAFAVSPHSNKAGVSCMIHNPGHTNTHTQRDSDDPTLVQKTEIPQDQTQLWFAFYNTDLFFFFCWLLLLIWTAVHHCRHEPFLQCGPIMTISLLFCVCDLLFQACTLTQCFSEQLWLRWKMSGQVFSKLR